ncbi:hypothetical protein I6E29_06440 [Arcanobacterium haemolyticum]|nr:hypothetical protein [Arcanobacterium haemolyticum]
MRASEFAKETAKTVLSQKVSTGIVVVLTAAMCLVTVLTLGRTTIASHKIDAELEAPRARTLTLVRGQQTPPLDRRFVGAIAAFDDAAHVIGVGSAQDAYNGAIGAGGDPVPLRSYAGDWGAAIRLESGRLPEPGEALLPGALAKRAGLDSSFGFLIDRAGREYPVVGAFSSTGLFPKVDEAGLLVSDADTVDRIYALGVSIEAAHRLHGRVGQIVAQPPFDTALIEMPEDVRALSASIREQFGDYSASLLVAILALGGLLIASTVFAGVISHAVDLGRRRVLGASRDLVTGLVVASTLLPAICGGAVGAVVGMVVVSRSGASPDWAFTGAVIVLAVLVAGIASLPPALYSAYRDPVLVLHRG